jgi:hypothetical protein
VCFSPWCGGDSAIALQLCTSARSNTALGRGLQERFKQRIAGNEELDVRADFQRETMIVLRHGGDKERRDGLRALSRGIGLQLHMWNKDMLGVMLQEHALRSIHGMLLRQRLFIRLTAADM